ncbi:hypothetical protein LCGC14_2237560 [marine sediment metagenome]|uniref:Uncharacterized protein n=1 Tax=marine sediment metagenome TaxID=412755 RepID=A0A0F9D6J9_9ZZZZ
MSEIYDDPMTVKKLEKILDMQPDNAIVEAYEGEGGGWIIVRNPEDENGIDSLVDIHTTSAGEAEE